MASNVLVLRILLFAVVWIGMASATGVFMLRHPNVGLKKRLLPWIASLFGLVFIVTTQYLGLPLDALYVVAPALSMLLYYHVRATRFCMGCGAYNPPNQPLFKVKSCHKCGAALEKNAL